MLLANLQEEMIYFHLEVEVWIQLLSNIHNSRHKGWQIYSRTWVLTNQPSKTKTTTFLLTWMLVVVKHSLNKITCQHHRITWIVSLVCQHNQPNLCNNSSHLVFLNLSPHNNLHHLLEGFHLLHLVCPNPNLSSNNQTICSRTWTCNNHHLRNKTCLVVSRQLHLTPSANLLSHLNNRHNSLHNQIFHKLINGNLKIRNGMMLQDYLIWTT